MPRQVTKSESVELSWLASAYLDAGLYLAEAIYKDDFPDSIHRGRVPLFLIRHALELIYKGALGIKTGSYPETHDLRRLKADFEHHYADIAFPIPEIILKEAVSDHNLELFPNLPVPGDKDYEQLRYPTDRKGQFIGNRAVDLVGSIDELRKLHIPVQKTWLKIIEQAGFT